MQATIHDNKISAPYNPHAIELFRQKAGRWNPEEKTWSFAPQVAKELFTELYGASEETVTVNIDYDHADEIGNMWYIGGYVLAQRRFRDARVTLGDGVWLLRGHFPGSGGSIKNPRVNASYDAVFQIEVRKDFAIKHGLYSE